MVLTREQIQKVMQEYFSAKPVNKAWLFGSYARNEADDASDVDVLVELDRSNIPGIEFYSWPEELGVLLNKKVDIVSAGWESKFIKPFIDKDKRIIYER